MDELLARVLRIHPEPCEYIDELGVHQALTAAPRDYIAFVESKLEAISNGQVRLELPAKQIFHDGQGDFRVVLGQDAAQVDDHAVLLNPGIDVDCAQPQFAGQLIGRQLTVAQR